MGGSGRHGVNGGERNGTQRHSLPHTTPVMPAWSESPAPIHHRPHPLLLLTQATPLVRRGRAPEGLKPRPQRARACTWRAQGTPPYRKPCPQPCESRPANVSASRRHRVAFVASPVLTAAGGAGRDRNRAGTRARTGARTRARTGAVPARRREPWRRGCSWRRRRGAGPRQCRPRRWRRSTSRRPIASGWNLASAAPAGTAGPGRAPNPPDSTLGIWGDHPCSLPP